MASDLDDVMSSIKTALDTVTGLRVFDYPPDNAAPPFAFPAEPVVEYDNTMGRGFDRMTFNVYVGVAMSDGRSGWEAVKDYADYDSVKSALEAGLGGASWVRSCEFGTIGLAGGNYLGAIFAIEAVV